MKWSGHVARTGDMRNACRILVGIPEGKRPLGRRGRRWEDNTEIAIRETQWTGFIWLRIGTTGWLL